VISSSVLRITHYASRNRNISRISTPRIRNSAPRIINNDPRTRNSTPGFNVTVRTGLVSS